MPAAVLDSPDAMGDVKEKKHKRSKSEKKRQREEDEEATPRRHKKSKKHRDEDEDEDEQPPVDQEEEKKKSKKHKKSKHAEDAVPDPAEEGEQPAKKSKKHKKHAPEDAVAEDTPKKRKKDKSKKKAAEEADDEEEAASSQSKRKSKKRLEEEPEAMDLDDNDDKNEKQPSFPFYTQTISLYVPFYPVGFDKPITNAASQHLEPLLNHYSPLLGGVLLAYRNVNLSERPVRPDPGSPPDDRTPALLRSLDEYAVGFGWLTADVDLFVPSRGALMEGRVNLQSEGHVGVVCWDRFNASIEAKRLPAGWRWVDLQDGSGSGHGGNNSNSSNAGKKRGKRIVFSDNDDNADDNDTNENDDDTPEEGTDILDDSPLELAELHTTGYWADGTGARIACDGAPLRFRIKNFDVGVAGDYGYISIEGTTLDDGAERELGRQEREAEVRRREKIAGGGIGVRPPPHRRVPEFSMTSFGREEAEEDSVRKTVLYHGSRPGTPDD